MGEPIHFVARGRTAAYTVEAAFRKIGLARRLASLLLELSALSGFPRLRKVLKYPRERELKRILKSPKISGIFCCSPKISKVFYKLNLFSAVMLLSKLLCNSLS